MHHSRTCTFDIDLVINFFKGEFYSRLARARLTCVQSQCHRIKSTNL